MIPTDSQLVMAGACDHLRSACRNYSSALVDAPPDEREKYHPYANVEVAHCAVCGLSADISAVVMLCALDKQCPCALDASQDRDVPYECRGCPCHTKRPGGVCGWPGHAMVADLLTGRPLAAGKGARLATALDEPRDFEGIWRDFWSAICEPGGKLDLEQVKRELCDYSTLLDGIPAIFDHVTAGRASKPMTYPAVIIALHDDAVTEQVYDEVEDVLSSLRDNVREALRSIKAAVYSIIGEATDAGWKDHVEAIDRNAVKLDELLTEAIDGCKK